MSNIPEFLSIKGNSTGSDAVGTSGAEIAAPTTGTNPARKAHLWQVTCDLAIHYAVIDATGQTKLATQMPILHPGNPGVILRTGGAFGLFVRSVTGTAKVRVTPLEG